MNDFIFQVFFINHIDKRTTWVDPRTGRPSPLPFQSNVPNRRNEDDLGPLPEGNELKKLHAILDFTYNHIEINFFFL